MLAEMQFLLPKVWEEKVWQAFLGQIKLPKMQSLRLAFHCTWMLISFILLWATFRWAERKIVTSFLKLKWCFWKKLKRGLGTASWRTFEIKGLWMGELKASVQFFNIQPVWRFVAIVLKRCFSTNISWTCWNSTCTYRRSCSYSSNCGGNNSSNWKIWCICCNPDILASTVWVNRGR